ncbi:hypothetical protein EDB87DRAFT_1575853 [Lactarius vividus]|nr:hypothetical protein EDB87DRAFT_1575853 [Lactarius vividus]
MSFPAEAPSVRPPGIKLGVFAGGGPFPRLAAPGIVVGDPAQLSSRDPSYMHIGLTHVLIRTTVNPFTRTPTATPGAGIEGIAPLVFEEQQSLREVVELLVRVRSAHPHGRVLVGEPFVATAYLMAIEGRDLYGTWRLVTGEALARAVFRQVHAVLGQFARDVEEEGKRLAREEELIELRREKLQLQQAEQRAAQEEEQQPPLTIHPKTIVPCGASDIVGRTELDTVKNNRKRVGGK